MPDPLHMLRVREVCARTGKTHSVIHRDIREGLFCSPVKIGPRASAWPAHEVEQINRARLAGKSDEYIRELVKRLMRDRVEFGEAGSKTALAA